MFGSKAIIVDRNIRERRDNKDIGIVVVLLASNGVIKKRANKPNNQKI